MTSLDAIVNNSSTTATATSSSTSSTSNDQMGKDTFLKLLVAQLKYQDPSNPADATQFLSQTAQFSVVEKLADLTTLDQQMLTASQSQSAAGLIGKQISWTDSSNKTQTGVVTSATLGASPTLTVGNLTVDLSAVTSVSAVTSKSGS
jgi:flagellar basal-body rod modification protein FlgD